MTKQLILNKEQLEARRQDVRRSNPNLSRIKEIDDDIRLLSNERAGLISDDEKYLNLMTWMAEDFDSKVAAVKCMDSPELADHLGNLFFEYTSTELDEAILTEAMNRLGWEPEDET